MTIARDHCDRCHWDGETPALRAWVGEGCGGVVWTRPVCPECGEEVYQPLILRHPPEAKRPSDTARAMHQRGATMATRNTPTKAQIDQVVELMEDTGIDLFLEVLPEVFINWEDADVLALLPAEIVEAALAYLRQEKQAQDEA